MNCPNMEYHGASFCVREGDVMIPTGSMIEEFCSSGGHEACPYFSAEGEPAGRRSFRL